MNKNSIKFGIILFLMIMTLFNTRLASSDQITIKNPGVFIEREDVGNTTYENLDPGNMLDNDPQAATLLKWICEPLIQYNMLNPGTYDNVLASSWSISPNGTVYTFHLKHNIKYQDGTPFNAYTMKYSIDREVLLNNIALFTTQQLDSIIVGAQGFQTVNDLNISQALSYLRAGGVVAQDEFTLLIKVNQPLTQEIVPTFENFYAISPSYLINHLPSTYTTNQSDNVYGMVSLKDMFPKLNDWTKLGLDSNHNPAISGIVPQADRSSPSLNTWALTHVVGTGPYRLFSSTIANITMVKFEDWHGTFAPNAPDKVELITDHDTTDRSIQFLQGNSDIWYLYDANTMFNYIDPSGNSIIDGVTAIIRPTAGTWELHFNLNDQLPAGVINPTPDIQTTWNMSHIINDHLVRYSTNDSILASIDNPFTALKFREAFSYAFDYSTYMKDMCFNNILGSRAHGLIPYGSFGYQENSINDGTIPGDMNTTKAQQLFEEVGWRGNITLKADISSHNDEVNTLLTNVINSLHVGITINYENTSYDKFKGADITFGLLEVPGDSYDFVNQLRMDTYFASLMNYSNPTIQKLLDKALVETDSAKLLSYYNQIEQIVANDYYCAYLNDINWLILVHNWIHINNQSFYQGGYLPEFLGKYQNLTTTTLPVTSQAKNTPGFEIGSLTLLLVLVLTRKKNKAVK